MEKLISQSSRFILSALTAAALLVLTSGCSSILTKPSFKLGPKPSDTISVMNFNTENFFDTIDDAEHNDETYLPLAYKNSHPEVQEACKEHNKALNRLQECLTLDWSQEAFNQKASNVAQIITSADPEGPDVVMFVEMENKNVLHQLNLKLEKSKYVTEAILDGPDKRGINLGFLSRFPLASEPILHVIPYKAKNPEDEKWMKSSRGIFEVTVRSPHGEPITFFIGHFPAQANPVEWRIQAAEYLVSLMNAKPPGTMMIAAGDFNITAEEENADGIFKNILSKAGQISHFIGCADCKGSHNYMKSWSFLDVQIYSPALQEKGTGVYQIDPQSIDVVRYDSIHLKQGKYPKRWDYDYLDGVSDHFPIYSRLKLR